MTDDEKIEGKNIDDESFAAGYEAAISDHQYDEIDDDYDEEALYDPAPRRRRKHITVSQAQGARKVRKGRKPVLVYDPAPAPRRRARNGKPRRSLMGKLKSWILPVVALGTFYSGYTKRAKDLNKTVIDAITYDVENFDSGEAVERLKTNAVEIATPGVAGYAVKASGIGGQYGKMLGDALMGVSVGSLAKTILDPPIAQTVRRTSAPVEVITVHDESGKKPCPSCGDQVANNPYM